MSDNVLPTVSRLHPPRERLEPKSWRLRAARRLRNCASWLETVDVRRKRHRAEQGAYISVSGSRILGEDGPKSKITEARYNATDPVWHDIEGDGCLVPLREHVKRLYRACLEIAPDALIGNWEAVAYNLKLAYSLTDLSADTDTDGAGMWCSPAADYDDADSEVTAKYLAATIVFTFVWSAYERVVATMRPSRAGKGAVGRDMIVGLARYHMPYLRKALFDALELDRSGTDFKDLNMRSVLKTGSAAGVAAEHLRQFRNRLIHGDLPKPEPKDWGHGSEYDPDRDCGLRRFHANTRLLLLLIQILACEDVHDGLELQYMLEEACGAKSLLRYLHCDCPTEPNVPELDLRVSEWPLPAWR